MSLHNQITRQTANIVHPMTRVGKFLLAGGAFVLPALAEPPPAQLIAETSARYSLTEPTLHIVSRDHELLEGKRHARAVVYESGREALYIAEDQTQDPERLQLVIEHELSHFAAWRKYGHGIQEHGPKWRSVCLASATNPEACTEG